MKDREALLAFYDFPAEHWKHLRTTNPIESTFATVRHRTVRSRGCVSNKTALDDVFKLTQAPSVPSSFEPEPEIIRKGKRRNQHGLTEAQPHARGHDGGGDQHPPSDRFELLGDGVRVLIRTMKKITQIVGEAGTKKLLAILAPGTTPRSFPHAAARLRVQARQRRPRHSRHPSLSRAPLNYVHRALYGFETKSVQEFLNFWKDGGSKPLDHKVIRPGNTEPDGRIKQMAAKFYALSASGTFPPFSASLIITCLCSQIFMAAEFAISPV